MKVKNKNTFSNFDPAVLKNMILFSLKSNNKFIINEDLLEYTKDNTIYDFIVSLFLDEVSKVIMIKPLKKYIYKEEDLYYVKGKINIKETKLHNFNNKVRCIYDEMSLDNNLNRIIKYVTYHLLNNAYLLENEKIKTKLINVYYYLKSVKLVDIKLNDVEKVCFCKDNFNYETLLIICKYILGSIKSDINNKKYIDTDATLWWVYQEFIRNYYDYNRKKLRIKKVSSSRYEWNFIPIGSSNDSLLPNMQTDIELEMEDEYIIIDAKCYEESLICFKDKKMFIPSHLYQLKAYLDIYKQNYKNNKVRGILIYPFNRNSKLNAGKQKYYNDDYTLEVITIDFKNKWEDICEELNEII